MVLCFYVVFLSEISSCMQHGLQIYAFSCNPLCNFAWEVYTVSWQSGRLDKDWNLWSGSFFMWNVHLLDLMSSRGTAQRLSSVSEVRSLMMYLGRCLVSRYILPMYSPITPRQRSWMKHMIHTVLAHPDTVFPSKSPMTAHIIPIKLRKAIRTPNMVIIRIGLTERLVIPSKASASIFFSG